MRSKAGLAVRTSVLRTLLYLLPGLCCLACVDDSAPDGADGLDASRLDASVGLDATASASDAQLDSALALASGSGCNLSGRWIMTEHLYLNVLGAHQVEVDWFYVELAQQGDQLTMTTAINCGGTIAGLSPVVVQLDDSASWPAYMAQVRYDGRKGSSSDDGDGCRVTFDEMVLVRGATVSTYRDLSVPLPNVGQPATGAATPGWEDWDDDGHPGITSRVSGAMHGLLYLTSRTWSQYAGTSPRDATSFTLSNDWGQERVTLDYMGGPLLVYQSSRDPNEAEQFVEFARLTPSQATGDDASKCQAIRGLAATLTPHANAR